MSDKLEKVISIVAQIDPEAARRAAAELKQINDQREQNVIETENRITSAVDKAVDARTELARKELNELEDQLKSKYDKEIEQLLRLQRANEMKYQDVINKARDAANAQHEINKQLSQRDTEEYNKYLQNKDILHKRQVDVEKERERGIVGPSFFEAAKQKLESNYQNSIGNAVGTITNSLPNVTEDDKRTRIMGETLEATIKSRTPMEALVNIGGGLLRYAQMSFEEDMRRTRESIRAAGGTLQFTGEGGMDVESAKKLRESLEGDGLVLRKNLAQVDAVITELGRSRVSGFGQASSSLFGPDDMSAQKDIFNKVRQSADLLGETWSDHARRIGDMTRKEVDARTGNVMSLETGIDNVNRTFLSAQKVSKEFGEIDLQKFVKNWEQLHDTLRPFGFSMTDTTKLITRFGLELDRGIVSLNDLVQWSTGVTKADDASRAFLFQEILRTTKENPQFSELQKTLEQASGQGPIAQSYLIQALTEGNSKELTRLGLSSGGMGDIHNVLQYTQNRMASEFSGGQGGLSGAASMDFFWRQFAAGTAGQSLDGKTIEARRALTSKGSYGDGDELVGTIKESNDQVIQQLQRLDKTVENTRTAESRGAISNALRNNLGIAEAFDESGGGSRRLSEAEEAAARDAGAYKETIRQQITTTREAWAATLEKYAQDFMKAEESGDFSGLGDFPMDNSDARIKSSFPRQSFETYDSVQKSFVKDELEPALERALERQKTLSGAGASLDVNVRLQGALEDSDLQRKLKDGISSIMDEHMRGKQKTQQERAIESLMGEYGASNG